MFADQARESLRIEMKSFLIGLASTKDQARESLRIEIKLRTRCRRKLWIRLARACRLKSPTYHTGVTSCCDQARESLQI